MNLGHVHFRHRPYPYSCISVVSRHVHRSRSRMNNRHSGDAKFTGLG